MSTTSVSQGITGYSFRDNFGASNERRLGEPLFAKILLNFQDGLNSIDVNLTDLEMSIFENLNIFSCSNLDISLKAWLATRIFSIPKKEDEESIATNELLQKYQILTSSDKIQNHFNEFFDRVAQSFDFEIKLIKEFFASLSQQNRELLLNCKISIVQDLTLKNHTFPKHQKYFKQVHDSYNKFIAHYNSLAKRKCGNSLQFTCSVPDTKKGLNPEVLNRQFSEFTKKFDTYSKIFNRKFNQLQTILSNHSTGIDPVLWATNSKSLIISLKEFLNFIKIPLISRDQKEKNAAFVEQIENLTLHSQSYSLLLEKIERLLLGMKPSKEKVDASNTAYLQLLIEHAEQNEQGNTRGKDEPDCKVDIEPEDAAAPVEIGPNQKFSEDVKFSEEFSKKISQGLSSLNVKELTAALKEPSIWLRSLYNKKFSSVDDGTIQEIIDHLIQAGQSLELLQFLLENNLDPLPAYRSFLSDFSILVEQWLMANLIQKNKEPKKHTHSLKALAGLLDVKIDGKLSILVERFDKGLLSSRYPSVYGETLISLGKKITQKDVNFCAENFRILLSLIFDTNSIKIEKFAEISKKADKKKKKTEIALLKFAKSENCAEICKPQVRDAEFLRKIVLQSLELLKNDKVNKDYFAFLLLRESLLCAEIFRRLLSVLSYSYSDDKIIDTSYSLQNQLDSVPEELKSQINLEAFDCLKKFNLGITHHYQSKGKGKVHETLDQFVRNIYEWEDLSEDQKQEYSSLREMMSREIKYCFDKLCPKIITLVTQYKIPPKQSCDEEKF